jgi:hypothetical protein
LRRDRPGLAVVLMTGHLDSPAEGAGEAVLMKPFGPDRVFAALARARAATRTEAAPAAGRAGTLGP